MTDAPSVRVAELRQALDRVLEAVEERLGSTVDLGADHYRTLKPEAAYGLVPDPELHLIAEQLSDDVEELQDILNRPQDEGIAIWHDLGHLCGLLQRIAFLDVPG